MSKSSALFDNIQQQDTQPTLESTTPTTNVNAKETNTDQAADAQFQPYEFINLLCTPVQEVVESSLHPEMCMFMLTVSTAEPKNIKEEMADHAWFEAMEKELH
nr:hypothetical protein [Tanacetum cinerariifolium]